MKEDELAKADTYLKICKLDPKDSKLWLPMDKVDVGVAAQKELRSGLANKKISEKQRKTFRSDCQKFLSSMVQKLVERCPMKFQTVHATTCLVPSNVVSGKSNAQTKFKKLVQKFYDCKWISSTEGDKAKTQFTALASAAQVKWKRKFESFDENNDRLDDFYHSLIGNDDSFKECWSVIRKCLIFSHGQASVESGFSVNGSILVENLLEESLVCQRLVYDGLVHLGGLKSLTKGKILVDKKMMNFVKTSNSRYKDALKEKELKTNQHKERERERELKRKKEIVADLEAKKAKVIAEQKKAMLELQMEIDSLNAKK